MTKDELRSHFNRLIRPQMEQEVHNTIKIYKEFLFKVILNQNLPADETIAKRDAKTILEMVFTKIACIEKMFGGIEFVMKMGAS